MPSIFNDHNNRKFRDLAASAATVGEDTVGKAIAKGLHIGYKTIIGIVVGVVVVIGFVIGSFNVAKHLEAKNNINS